MKEHVLNAAAYVNLLLIATVAYAAITGGTIIGGPLVIVYFILAFSACAAAVASHAADRRNSDRVWMIATTVVALLLPWVIRALQRDWWDAGEIVRFYVAPGAAALSVCLSVLILVFARRSTTPSALMVEMLVRAVTSLVIGIAVYVSRDFWPRPLEQWIVTWFALVIPICFVAAAALLKFVKTRNRGAELGHSRTP